MDSTEEELDALKSLYYQEGEFMQENCESEKGNQITVKLNVDAYIQQESMKEKGLKEIELQQLYSCFLCLFLPYAYPQEHIRNVKISSSFLSGETLQFLNNEVKTNHRKSPLNLLELCSLCQQLVEEQIKVAINFLCYKRPVLFNQSENDQTASNDLSKQVQVNTCLLHLDHMRARAPYIKLIRRWVSELGLSGVLMFASKFILILLQGQPSAIKEYIIRNRTTNVDIDSKGRSCKERMLTVLVDKDFGTGNRLSGFEILEGPLDQTQLKDRFLSYDFGDLYNEYVKNIR